MHRLPVGSGRFRTKFSIRCTRGFHASKLELGSLCLAMRALARRPRWHRSRTFALVDAQAVYHSVKKGRSSAPNFWHGSRCLASILLACDIQLHVGYIPGRWNPADGPSRGKVRSAKSAASAPGRSGLSKTHLRSDKAFHNYRRAVRRLARCGHFGDTGSALTWNSSDSLSTCGQPSF